MKRRSVRRSKRRLLVGRPDAWAADPIVRGWHALWITCEEPSPIHEILHSSSSFLGTSDPDGRELLVYAVSTAPPVGHGAISVTGRDG